MFLGDRVISPAWLSVGTEGGAAVLDGVTVVVGCEFSGAVCLALITDVRYNADKSGELGSGHLAPDLGITAGGGDLGVETVSSCGVVLVSPDVIRDVSAAV